MTLFGLAVYSSMKAGEDNSTAISSYSASNPSATPRIVLQLLS